MATLWLFLMGPLEVRKMSGQGRWRRQLRVKKRLTYMQDLYTRASPTTGHPHIQIKKKNKDKKTVSPSPSPTLVDPSHVSVLGKVDGEKAVVQPETTPAGKKKRSNLSKSSRLSKKKPSTSSRPSSEDLKNLDDKWAERFARLKAMPLSKSFAVLVEPVVKPAEAIFLSWCQHQ